MNAIRKLGFTLGALLLLQGGEGKADAYDVTVEIFKNAGESATFFAKSYADRKYKPGFGVTYE
jgi:hypothetical protein